MSKKSSTFREYDYEFDPRGDYEQVLKEAREHANQSKVVEASLTPNSEEPKKSKKSWTYSLFFWRRPSEKRNKSQQASVFPLSSNGYGGSKPKQGGVAGPIGEAHMSSKFRSKRPTSGPITGSRMHVPHMCRSNSSTSGPLASLFTPLRKGEGDMPYMSLNQARVPLGPIYLVT